MPDRRLGTWDRFVAWLNGVDCLIYSSHALSSWGNRMWQFSLGIILVALDGGQLRTVAAYGLTMGCAVILLMALIGDWIDRTERLRVVKITLVIQNALVIVTAVTLCLVLVYHDDTKRLWSGQLKTLCLVIIICLATMARLASEGLKIAIEKDWVVVIAQRDKTHLTKLNASMRRIDLVTNILSPAVIGQVITFVSLQAGALVVAGWNLFSMFLEYYLLVRVYQRVPNLSIKSQTMAPPDAGATTDEHDEQLEHPHVPQKEDTTQQKILTEAGPNNADKIEGLEEDEDYKSPYATTVEASTEHKKGCCRLIFDKFIIFYQGFGTYLRQEVVCAGLGLGFLYMTVLGFDSITIGFAYDQGVSASILGILMAVGSIVGILGTICFTLMRRRIGLERTGLFSFSFEIACLILCVVSVWTPGSPFFGYNKRPFEKTQCRGGPTPVQHVHAINVETIPPVTVENTTVYLSTTPASIYNTTNSTGPGRRKRDNLHLLRHSRDLHLFHSDGVLFYPHISSEYRTSYNNRYRRQTTNDSSNTTGGPSTSGTPPGYTITPPDPACFFGRVTVGASYISVTLLMAGIITARFGLWMADLTVTQILQENVEESQRGVVNGVQTALNMFMDTIKFIIVIIAPREETFGILIVVSFVFICIGGCFYARYSYTVRGHLFHFDGAAGRCRGGKKNGAKRPGDTLASFRTDDHSTSDTGVAVVA